MSGDYSKHGFNPNKDYSGVLMQQGRVQLDRDWNEQIEIQDRRLRAETADLLGRCGVPQETPDGFKIDVLDARPPLTIGRGRIYVDGLLAENHGAGLVFHTLLAELRGTASLRYDQQPYLPNPPDLPGPRTGRLLIYLDVWQREVTFLKDPDLVEIAVGVDTTTRLQTVWQVRFLPVGDRVTCATPINRLPNAPQPSAGRLSTDTIDVDPAQDPCVIPPSGGFRGLENRLYRVEIHNPGPEGLATFKWSANNAVLTTAVTAIDPSRTELKVETTRKDSMLQFRVGDWVEIKDDVQEFALQPGVMRKIADVDHGTGTITLDAELPDNTFDTVATDPDRHTRLRQWHQKGQILDGSGDVIGDVDANGGVILVPAGADPVISIQLNDGVIVTFETDPVGDEFRVADYWNFAARTADASVEKLIKAPPRGIHHHYCRLALLEHLDSKWVPTDWRPLFPPLTSLTRLHYVGGDGQEMMPDPTGTEWLCGPLQVRVVNGGTPVKDALVRFEIAEPDPRGTATVANPPLPILDPQLVEVRTDPDGLAACLWRLDENSGHYCQKVTATLIECDEQIPHQKIEFSANLSLASEVANITGCTVLGVNATVQDALDTLCENSALYYVGGDGQEGNAGQQLCAPLEVRVANGRHPVSDATVRFTILAGHEDGGVLIENMTEPVIDVTTDENGLADCRWRLGNEPLCQRVEAILVGVDTLPVHFNARLSDIADPAIRVREVVLLRTGNPLQNDTQITLDQLEAGIGVVCDGEIHPETIKRPTCYVTLEDPTLVERIFDNDVFDSAYVPLVLSSTLAVVGEQITWVPTELAIALLNRLNPARPILARLTIKGNFAWGGSPSDPSRSYLDGDTLGIRVRGISDPFGNPAIGVLLPSGDRHRGGDFEMWFWIRLPGQTVPTVPNVLIDTTIVRSGNTVLFLDNYDTPNLGDTPVAQTGAWIEVGGATVQNEYPGIEPVEGQFLQFIAAGGRAMARFDAPDGIFTFDTRFLVPSGTNNNQGRAFFFTVEDEEGNVAFSISFDGPLANGQGRLVDVRVDGGVFNELVVKADTWHHLVIQWDGIVGFMRVFLDNQIAERETTRLVPQPTRLRIDGPQGSRGDASSLLSLSRTTLDFGDLPTNTTGRASFTVRNTSNEPVLIEGFDFDNASFGTRNQPLTLQPGESTRVRVTFRPSSAGSSTGRMTIRTDKGSLTVDLQGTGR